MKRGFLLAASALALVASLGAQEDSIQQSAEFSANFVVSRWIEALGSQAALSKIHSLTIDEAVDDGKNGRKVSEHIVIANQGRFRFEITDEKGRVLTEGFDGNKAWRQSDQLGFGLMNQTDLRNAVFRESPILPLLLANHYTKATLLNDDLVDGVACHVYSMSAENSTDEVWTAESATGLVRLIKAVSPTGQVIMHFGDYRPVEALTLPFETRIETNDTVIAVHRKSIRLDQPAYQTFFTATPWDLRDAETVQQVLDKYVKHAESAEALQAIHSRVVKSVITTPATGVTSNKAVTILFPNKVLIDTQTTGMGDEIDAFNGKVGWELTDLQGFRILKPSEVPSLFSNLSTQADRALSDEAPLRRIVGDRVVQGHRTTAIALSTLNGPIGIFYFDKESGRLLRVGSIKQKAMTGVPESTIDYSDFKQVDGIETAFTTTLTTSTLQVITTITSIENNVAIDEDIFDPPPQDP